MKGGKFSDTLSDCQLLQKALLHGVSLILVGEK